MDMIISGKYKDFDYITVIVLRGRSGNWAGAGSQDPDLSFGRDCSICAETLTHIRTRIAVDICRNSGQNWDLADGAARPYISTAQNDG